MSGQDRCGSELGSAWGSPLWRKLSACGVATHLNACLPIVANCQNFK